jgi:threonine/homoserine/homoserine lactone efflux protein
MPSAGACLLLIALCLSAPTLAFFVTLLPQFVRPGVLFLGLIAAIVLPPAAAVCWPCWRPATAWLGRQWQEARARRARRQAEAAVAAAAKPEPAPGTHVRRLLAAGRR